MKEPTQPSRSRRWWMIAVVAAFAMLPGYFMAVFYAVWSEAQVEDARPADVIVVLGAAQYRGRPSPVLRARLDHALALYRRNLAPRILTTGGYGEGAEFSEGQVSREYLSAHGVPAEMVTVETRGKSTMQSASAVAEIMDRMELKSCIVVSDDYHIFRIKKMLEARGIEVHGSPRRLQNVSGWRRCQFYARESLAYILWRVGIRM